MGNTEHSFSFDAKIETTVGQTVTEEEYKDFSKEDESLEEYARRKALENAPVRITRKIADNGVAKSAITLGELNTHHEHQL